MPGYYIVTVSKPEGVLKGKKGKELATSLIREIKRLALELQPKQTAESDKPMKFTIKRTLNSKDSKVQFLYNKKSIVGFDASDVTQLIESAVKEANLKFEAFKNDLNILLFDDCTELQLLDMGHEIGKYDVIAGVEAIDETYRENISHYYVLEGPLVYRIL